MPKERHSQSALTLQGKGGAVPRQDTNVLLRATHPGRYLNTTERPMAESFTLSLSQVSSRERLRPPHDATAESMENREPVSKPAKAGYTHAGNNQNGSNVQYGGTQDFSYARISFASNSKSEEHGAEEPCDSNQQEEEETLGADSHEQRSRHFGDNVNGVNAQYAGYQNFRHTTITFGTASQAKA